MYFKFKEKNGYAFLPEEKIDFQQLVLSMLSENSNWVKAKTLIIPETGNSGLIELAHLSGKEVVTLYKAQKEEIKTHLETQSMMKAEREKLFSAIAAMDKVKMAGIAGNQRKRFIECLFKTPDISDTKDVVFFDDSMFSGYTYLAAQHRLDFEHHNIILFDKNI